jgi:hypothetical protein
MVVSDNCGYKVGDPKRTWPDKFFVSYRYKIQRIIKGDTITSPNWSPIAVVKNKDACQLNAQGFYYGPAYYSAQMVIPDPDLQACTYILQRCFDKDYGGNYSDKWTTIKSRVSKPPAEDTLYLCDDEGP